jgi:hypothetical protein
MSLPSNLSPNFKILQDPICIDFTDSIPCEKSHCRLDSTLSSFLIPGIDFFLPITRPKIPARGSNKCVCQLLGLRGNFKGNVSRNSGFRESKVYIINCVVIFKQPMGARNRVGIGLSYRPARLHSLA